MLNSFVFSAAVGTILGFLTGLGIGGGSLLMLWLTLVVGFDQTTARGINLLFFLPAAAISCFFQLRQGDLNLRTCLPAMISGCIAAAGASWVSSVVDTAVLRKPFGILLLATGLREVLYRRKKQ